MSTTPSLPLRIERHGLQIQVLTADTSREIDTAFKNLSTNDMTRSLSARARSSCLTCAIDSVGGPACDPRDIRLASARRGRRARELWNHRSYWRLPLTVHGRQSRALRQGVYPNAVCVARGANPIGRRVKLADLRDNSDLSRITNPTVKNHQRIAKYARAVEL